MPSLKVFIPSEEPISLRSIRKQLQETLKQLLTEVSVIVSDNSSIVLNYCSK